MLDPELDPESQAQPQEIPNKLYFRIGEVSRLAGIKPYVLRFWETEFPSIEPKKSGTGHRLYRRKDVELILEIKHLLYDKRFTIEGARKFMEEKAQQERHTESGRSAQQAQPKLFQESITGLDDLKKELRAILEILNRPAK